MTPLIPVLVDLFEKGLEALSPVFDSIVAAIAPLIPQVVELIKKFVPLLPMLVELAITVITPLIALGVELAEVFAPLIPLLIELAIAVITPLIPLVLQLIEAFLPLIPVLIELEVRVLSALIPLFLALIEALLPLLPIIVELAVTILPPLVEVFALVIETLTPLIVLLAEGLVLAIQTLTPFIEGLVVFVAGIAIAVLNVKDTWEAAWEKIKAAFDTALRGILAFYNQTLVPMFNALAAALDVVKGVWDTVWGVIGSSPRRAAETCQECHRRSKSRYRCDQERSQQPEILHEQPQATIPQFSQPAQPQSPRIRRRVQNFAGGAAIVGERGPELLNLPRGSNVTPLGAGAGGGGTTVNNNYYILTIEDFQKMVNEARTSFGRRGN